MTAPIRIVVAEDHFLARLALVAYVRDQADMELVGTAETGAEAIAVFREQRPDLVLLDLDLPVLDGYSVITAIRQEDKGARILVLSNLDGEEDIHRALQAGARGYLRKDVTGEILLDAIRRVHAGQRYLIREIAEKVANRSTLAELTARETGVLKLIVEGHSNREIAELLGLREGTIRIYVSNVLVKLDVKSRTEAAFVAVKRGLVRPG